jgi:2-methylisocitrate lyase-like PEP mutase family enzyme
MVFTVVSQHDKADRFRALHVRAGAFVMPNPWDPGSARLLAGLGFEALATTSAGFAAVLGRADGEVSRDEQIEHCRRMCEATDLPLSADLENGFGDDPATVAETIRQAIDCGLSGGSIEDYTGDRAKPIYPLTLATERIHAAVEAVRASNIPFVLTARAENLLHGKLDLDDTIRRLQAYEAAGADVLYAPGLTTLEDVRTVTGALTRPVNVLAVMVKGASIATLVGAGAKRLSVGGALARAAFTAVIRAGVEMQGDGTFAWTGDLTPTDTVLGLLKGTDPRHPQTT